MFRKLKSVVVFLKIIVSFVLTRPFIKYFPSTPDKTRNLTRNQSLDSCLRKTRILVEENLMISAFKELRFENVFCPNPAFPQTVLRFEGRFRKAPFIS